MKPRVVILGAGFGGLELATILSDTFGDTMDIVLVDKADSFVLGFSKLDVMFGKQMPADIHHPYRHIVKPGVRFLQSTVRAIDPIARRVVTDHGTFDAEVLVVALGADLDPAATPGLVEGGSEFYTVEGAETLRDILPRFEKGHAIVGVTSTPFKCPPAPSETALLLHDYLVARGCRSDTEISLVMPYDIPIPPSPETSQALLATFTESWHPVHQRQSGYSARSSPQDRHTQRWERAALRLVSGYPGASCSECGRGIRTYRRWLDTCGQSHA